MASLKKHIVPVGDISKLNWKTKQVKNFVSWAMSFGAVTGHNVVVDDRFWWWLNMLS